MNINFENKETILQSIQKVAEKIANNTILTINDALYRIVDFEFYLYTKNNVFQDPHTYKNDLQFQNNKLYLHGSGIDITVGDGENHAGILLRSVIKLGEAPESGFMIEQYDGPQKVATELFSNLNPLDSNKLNKIDLDLVKHNQDACLYPATKLLKTKRVGLNRKIGDADNVFLDLPLRYIAIVPKFKQTIKNKEGLLDEQVANGSLSQEEATQLLGYNKKS